MLSGAQTVPAESPMTHLRTRLVTNDEWHTAHRRTGSIYFLRNAVADCIKIGHSREPILRTQTLQVGSPDRLTLIGLIAASIEIEPLIHDQLREGHARGEWFWDRGVTSIWLLDMTQGEPMCRHIWDLVPTREVFWGWNDATKMHTKHIWNPATQQWEPPLANGLAS